MFASRMKIARVGRAAAAERQIARVGRAAAASRQFASLSGARAYLPKFSTVALSGTVLVVGGGLAYDRWMTKMSHDTGVTSTPSAPHRTRAQAPLRDHLARLGSVEIKILYE